MNARSQTISDCLESRTRPVKLVSKYGITIGHEPFKARMRTILLRAHGAREKNPTRVTTRPQRSKVAAAVNEHDHKEVECWAVSPHQPEVCQTTTRWNYTCFDAKVRK